MPATIKTEENFPKDTSNEEMEREKQLRIQAGAIRSEIRDEADKRVLVTEWNVIGGQ